MEHSLDLHGVKHGDVFRLVDNFIGKHIVGCTKEVEIITGHSKEMKRLVKDVLEEYKVSCRDKFTNQGILVVNLT